MRITDTLVLKIANLTHEEQARFISQTNNLKPIIEKAKELMIASQSDKELTLKLDTLIGACSIPEMKERLGEACELSP